MYLVCRTRAGYSRADQFYASYPAGTELLTDTAKVIGCLPINWKVDLFVWYYFSETYSAPIYKSILTCFTGTKKP